MTSFAANDPERLGAEAIAIADELDALAQRAAGLLAELVGPWVRRFEAAQAEVLSRSYATSAERVAAETAFNVAANEELVLRALVRLEGLFPFDYEELEHRTTWDLLAAR